MTQPPRRGGGPRRRASRLVVLAALAVAGCPPPPDVAGPGASPPAPEPQVPPDPVGSGGPQRGPAPGPAPAAPGGGEGPAAARPAGTDAPAVFEKLRGGVHVARCPSCGEVLAEGATSCPGCRQSVSAWRHEETCPRCVGEGRCDRCGDDRVCLACDGDGKCGACGGSGAAPRGGACPECGGNKQCGACRGDGRREVAAGDFLPTEGWMPGSCATCLDASGLCPDCGATGRDSGGNPCVTCGGNRVCPDCAGEGDCTSCAADGNCPECAGGGVLVRNGAPRGPDSRVRRLRTAAGSPLVAVAEGPPTVQAAKLAVRDAGRTTSTSLSRSQLDAVSWVLLVRDFPPGWEGRAAADPAEVAEFRMRVAATAVEGGLWGPALRELRTALAIDPAAAAKIRLQISDVEQRRAEAWSKRADEAVRAGDRERAIPLLESVVFAARGSALAKRAELQVLGLRKDRESELAGLAEAERVRRATDARAAVERTLARARLRFDRARLLLDRAGRSADDLAADRTFARAEFSAAAAARAVQAAAARHPAGDVAWSAAPAAVVTEARLLSANVLEAWATRAVAGGRFALGERLARRALATDPSSETLKNLLAQAETGRARTGVLQGSPPPVRR